MGSQAELRISRDGLRVLLRAVEAEVRRLELEIAATLDRVKEFERRYGMSSEEFLRRYVKGELGDEESYMEWYGELMFLEKARKELEELRRIASTASQRLPKEG